MAQGTGSDRGRGRAHGNSPLTATGARRSRRVRFARRRSDALIFVAAVAILAVSAIPIDPRHVGGFEARVFHFVNEWPASLYWPIWIVMQLGNFFAVVVVGVLALLTRGGRLAGDLVLSGVGAWVLAKVVKQVVSRGRPGQLLSNVILHHAPAAGHGFVAGHAATAFALATAAFPYLSRRTRWVMVALAAIVAIARVYVGAHLPLD
ncbi:MAG: phosphatase PAP2 family protein, partial [Actinomycetota bacterium]|nr:phosphatase PAP2 family protein [Actinomycetota bacterium]